MGKKRLTVFGAELAPVTTVAQLERVLGRCAKANQSAVVFGEPGVGKSAAVSAMALKAGRKLFSIHGPHHGPEDFKFPIVDTAEKLVHWVQTVFPSDQEWDGIVFIDEFGFMPPAVQSALLGLFHSGERRIGTDYVLPAKASVIGASNLMTDGCGRTISPMVLRPNKYLFDPDTSQSLAARTYNDEFCAWLQAQNYPAGDDVISFVRCYPDRLHDYAADRPADSPTPRGWAEVAQLLDPGIHPDDNLHVAGKIGPSVADQFCAHRELTVRIDPIAVVNHPETSTVPENEPALLWATVGAVAAVAAKATAKQKEGILKYLLRCPAEYAVYGVVDAIGRSKDKGMLGGAVGAKFLDKFGPLMATKAPD